MPFFVTIKLHTCNLVYFENVLVVSLVYFEFTAKWPFCKCFHFPKCEISLKFQGNLGIDLLSTIHTLSLIVPRQIMKADIYYSNEGTRFSGWIPADFKLLGIGSSP